MKRSWHIGLVLGVSLRIDITWLVIVVLITWSLAASYFPARFPTWPSWLAWVVGSASSILLFASVLTHELAHSWVALKRGASVQSITLFLFGGLAQLGKEVNSPLTEFLMALAGPIASLSLALFFVLVGWLTRAVNQPLTALAGYVASINGSLAIFNLMPGFPLDGGRLLRALLWRLKGDRFWATRIASRGGRGLAFLLLAWGTLAVLKGDYGDGLWIAFLGLYLNSIAELSYQQAILQEMLQGVSVAQLMERDFPPVSPALSLDRLVNEYALKHGRRVFPVMDGGKWIGVITLREVRRVSRGNWPGTKVAEKMVPVEGLPTVSPLEDGVHLARRLSDPAWKELPVVDGGELVGMLRRSDVLHYVQWKMKLVS